MFKHVSNLREVHIDQSILAKQKIERKHAELAAYMIFF